MSDTTSKQNSASRPNFFISSALIISSMTQAGNTDDILSSAGVEDELLEGGVQSVCGQLLQLRDVMPSCQHVQLGMTQKYLSIVFTLVGILARLEMQVSARRGLVVVLTKSRCTGTENIVWARLDG